MKKFNNLHEIEEKYDISLQNYINYTEIILNIFNTSKLNVNNYNLNDSVILLFIGFYFQHIEKNRYEMKHYYLIAIEKNNDCAMYNLGFYYEDTQIYDKMKYYYLMAIKKNNVYAMNKLGYYYKNIEKKYIIMMHYLSMAIKKNNEIAMNNLGFYYSHDIKNYNKMKYYYLIAIKNNNEISMYNLGFYYQRIGKNYEIMKYYYLMAIKKYNVDAINNLGYYYQHIEKNHDKMKYYYLMAINFNDEQSMTDLKSYYKENNELITFYLCLLQLSQNKLIANVILELKQTREITHFENKIYLLNKLKKYEQCKICLNCRHEICIECCFQNMKCYCSQCK